MLRVKVLYRNNRNLLLYLIDKEKKPNVIFEPYSKVKKLKCPDESIIRTGSKLNRRERCEEKCENDNNCKFYFYSQAKWCVLYSACNQYERSVGTGQIFKKHVTLGS